MEGIHVDTTTAYPENDETPLVSEATSSKRLLRCMKRKAFVPVLLCVVVVVIVIIIFVNKSSGGGGGGGGKPPGGQTFTLDNYLSGTLAARGASVNWFNASCFVQRLDVLNSTTTVLKLVFLPNFNEVILCSQSELLRSAHSWQVSSDATKVLFALEAEALYRHSTLARYVVYDVATSTVTNLTTGGVSSPPSSKVRYAVWSPSLDSVHRHDVVFVRDNNLFCTNVAQGPASERQLTFDGQLNRVINGVPDWVYEEEVFGFDYALWWSPSGSYVAFLRFNETLVPEYDFPEYGALYPTQYRYKYPLAGFANSVVDVAVFAVIGVQGASTVALLPRTDYQLFADILIPMVTWVNDTTLAYRVINRSPQNQQYILRCDVRRFLEDPEVASASVVINEQLDPAWIDAGNWELFLGATTSFSVSSSQFIGMRPNEGYMHLALFDWNSGAAPENGNSVPTVWLTSGAWRVTGIVGVGRDAMLRPVVYYTSAESGSNQQQLYSVTLDGVVKTRLTPADSWYSAVASPGATYFVVSYQGPNLPTVAMYAMSDFNTPVVTLQDNSALQSLLTQFQLPEKIYTTIPGVSTELNAYMLHPLNFDNSGNKRYPVVMNVYGGPGSQTARFQYSMDWHVYLASIGYMVVSVDNTGTGGRAQNFTQATFKRLGILEVADQIAAARYLATLPFVDPTRIAIWGWSYGGFMTSSVLAAGSGVFKAGIAVAPVTDWRYYDTIYTERYMLTPAQNPTGYADTSVLPRAQNITAAFLLVHGTADDNVHFQNSADFVTALVRGGVPFQTMYYPNNDHSLTGPGVRPHLYHMLTQFLQNNL